MRVFDWLGGVPRECVYDNFAHGGGQARPPRGGALEPAVLASARPLRVHSATCSRATLREKGSVGSAVGYLKTGFWPARRFQTLGEADGSMATGDTGSCTAAGTPHGSSSSQSG